MFTLTLGVDVGVESWFMRAAVEISFGDGWQIGVILAWLSTDEKSSNILDS